MAKALVKILAIIIVLVLIVGGALILANIEKQKQLAAEQANATQPAKEKLPEYFGVGNDAGTQENQPETLSFTAFMVGGKTQCGNFTCFEVQSMSGSGTIRPGDKISVKTDAEVPENAAELLITGSFEGNDFVAESVQANAPPEIGEIQ